MQATELPVTIACEVECVIVTRLSGVAGRLGVTDCPAPVLAREKVESPILTFVMSTDGPSGTEEPTSGRLRPAAEVLASAICQFSGAVPVLATSRFWLVTTFGGWVLVMLSGSTSMFG